MNNHTLMKSKRRVQKHGEVFTPQWVVDRMISIPGIKEKTENVFSTFLEPSAGEGAFLVAIEEMKLRYVTENFDANLWDCYALWALSSIYGIELLEDNLALARQNMLVLFSDYYEAVHGASLSKRSNQYKSARTIIWANVVQGNTLTHRTLLDKEIVLSHWEQIPEMPNKVRRKQFGYSSLLVSVDKDKAEQLDLFGFIDGKEEPRAPIPRYLIVDIDQVWREEREDV